MWCCLFQRELCEEYARYNAYLQQMKKEEEEEERQLDKIIDTEVEKQWQKRLAQWRLEREARKQLLDNVLATRQKQVQDKRKDQHFAILYTALISSIKLFA